MLGRHQLRFTHHVTLVGAVAVQRDQQRRGEIVPGRRS
jgi:hypothetical protein